MMLLLGHAYAASGKRAEAQRMRWGSKNNATFSLTLVATIYTGLGEKDEA